MDYIISSGIISSGLILNEDHLRIERGGKVNLVTVNSGGGLWVQAGGTATNIQWTPCEGYVSIDERAHVTFANQLSGVYYGSTGQLLSHAQVMTSKVVKYIGNKDEDEIYESMFVMSGGTANSTTIAGAIVEVWNGGTADNTIINACNGHDEEFGWGGCLHVRSGGTAKNTMLNNGWLSVHSGGKASKVIINNVGELEVEGKADGVILNAGGICQVDGGTVTIAQWTPCEGYISIEDGGGKVTFLSKYSGVYFGTNEMLQTRTGNVTSKNVGKDDMMVIMSGGTANDITCCGGHMQIWSEGQANNILFSYNQDVDWAGRLDVYSGGTANQTRLTSATYMYICNGGKAIDTTISGGRIEIYSGGTTSNTTILQYIHDNEDYVDNSIHVETGGIAINTTLNDGGCLYVQSGGIATNITLKSGSYLYVASGGMVGGITNLGGEIESKKGAIMDYVYKSGGTSSTTLTVSEDADGGGNNWMFDKKTGEMNDEVTDSEPTNITSDTWEIVVDADDIFHEDKNGNHYGNYVGQGDAVDFTRIYLENAAKLSITIKATDAAKITIWKLNETWKKNILSYSQKSLQSTKLTLNRKTGVYSADTKTLLLEAGEYYISVESTNAKKGGTAYYNVSLNENSVFFTNGDDGWNNWLYEKKTGPNPDRDDFITMVISSSTEEIQLDRDGDVDSGDWLNFVGYDDAADYAKIVLDGEAKLSFTIQATDAAKFVICKLTEKVSKKGVITYSQKTLQTTKLTKNKQTQLYAANTKALKLEAGEYFISVQSTNAKQGGNAYYSVNLNDERSWFSETVPDAKVADALECGNTFNREADLLAAGLGNGLNEKQSTWLDVAKLA